MSNKIKATYFRYSIWAGLVVFGVWWLFITFIIRDPNVTNNMNQAFAAAYGIMSLLGGVIGLIASRRWGGSKSLLGRALLFFALGLLAQEFGQIAYSVYVYVLKAQIPYPSVGDIGYFGSVLFYIYAATLLARAAGVKFSLRARTRKLIAIGLPLVLLMGSYAVFLQGYKFDFSSVQSCLTTFLDFGYPLGQACYIAIGSVTYLMSRRLLGGFMKNKILLLLFALLVQYVADFSFLYAARAQTAYPASANDLLYLLAYVVMSLGLCSFLSLPQQATANDKEVAG